MRRSGFVLSLVPKCQGPGAPGRRGLCRMETDGLPAHAQRTRMDGAQPPAACAAWGQRVVLIRWRILLCLRQMETAAIQTHGLTRHFGALTAVDNVTFSVAPGQFFGFLGPNGAGKSTTIKMLTGLLEPTAGTVEILGQPFGASAPAPRLRTAGPELPCSPRSAPGARSAS